MKYYFKFKEGINTKSQLLQNTTDMLENVFLLRTQALTALSNTYKRHNLAPTVHNVANPISSCKYASGCRS